MTIVQINNIIPAKLFYSHELANDYAAKLLGEKLGDFLLNVSIRVRNGTSVTIAKRGRITVRIYEVEVQYV